MTDLLSGDTPSAPQEASEPRVYVPGDFETHLAPSGSRNKVWKQLYTYFTRRISSDDDVFELGAGWCDFANQVRGGRRFLLIR